MDGGVGKALSLTHLCVQRYLRGSILRRFIDQNRAGTVLYPAFTIPYLVFLMHCFTTPLQPSDRSTTSVLKFPVQVPLLSADILPCRTLPLTAGIALD